MSVIFEAIIKEDGIGSWFIELKDTVSGRIENCKDVSEFQVKIEQMGEAYGGYIDEVKWEKEENLTPEHMVEVHAQMAQMNEEMSK